jgi:dTDP-glucose 4,6-dehydratase
VRDWLYVEDHCRAILALIEKGLAGEVYNIGGNCSLPNIDVIRRLLRATGRGEDLIEHVTDRPGHDRRYALSSAKLTRETGWQPQIDFDTGLVHTIEWYQTNQPWLQRVRSGAYQKYYETNYSARATALESLGLL